MNILITYSSKTGNTEKLATGIYKNINDESSMFDEIKPLFVSAVQNNSEEE